MDYVGGECGFYRLSVPRCLHLWKTDMPDSLLKCGAPLLVGQQRVPAGTQLPGTVPREPWAESRAVPGSY